MQTEKALKDKAKQAYVDPTKGAEAKERGNELFKQQKYPEALKVRITRTTLHMS